MLLVTALGSGMVLVEGTVVDVALPALGSDLDASLNGLQWTVNAFTLTLAALTLLGGGLGDRFGRRRVYLLGTVWFGVASLLCGAGPSIPADRNRAVGWWVGMSGVAGAAGPILGGGLIDVAGWRWVFFINVPRAAVLDVLLTAHVPGEPRRRAITPVRHRRCPPCRDRPGGVDVRPDPDRGRPVGVGGGAGRPSRLRHVPARRAPQPGADAAATAVPLASVQRREPGELLRLRWPGRHVLPAPDPTSGHRRILRVGGRPDAAAPYRPHTCPVAVRWRAHDPVRSARAAGYTPPVTTAILSAVPEGRAGIASAVSNGVARTAGLVVVAALPLLAGLPDDVAGNPAALDGGFGTSMVICAGLFLAGGLVAGIGLPGVAPPTRPLAEHRGPGGSTTP